MIDVVAAIIKKEDKFLIARKKQGKPLAGLWEFPGGKMELGETPEESLIRELKEEMNVTISVGKYLGETIYDYGNVVVRLKAYICSLDHGDIKLTDHDEFQWVTLEEFEKYNLAPADIPFINKLKL
jgi:8-oxo-dGTP diphosphatase